MNNKEAIKRLNNCSCSDYMREAIDLAIKALEARPQGEWINDSDDLPVCKECGEVALQRVCIKFPQLIQTVHMVRSNYCPNCGANMTKEA